MDRERIREREARCVAEQPPACTAGCPVHVDARALAGHVRRGDLDAALAVLARSLPLPRSLARVCDHPCEAVCRRGEAGDPVSVRALEQVVVEHGALPPVRRAGAAPRKAQRVAVVGAGLGGLTCALDLASRGYRVVLFEAGPRLGGRLLSVAGPLLPAEALAADLAPLGPLGVEVRTGSPVASALELVGPFDAVYAGPGPGGVACLEGVQRAADGAPAVDAVTGATSHPGLFAGGGLRPGGAWSPIGSVRDGRRAAASIDRLFQGASLAAGRELEGAYPSRLFTRTDRVAPAPRVAPADLAGGYSRAEAAEEAARCLDCACTECRDACPYLALHGATPRRYIREIYNNDGIVMGQRKANRLANGCALCGLCEVVCPEGLGMADTCREARQSMVARGKMPPSTHEFALRDLAFSQGPDFALARHAPGATASEAVFFPGCQLSASAPDQVREVYALLRRELGPVGLHLGCCGAPADWAGRQAEYARSLQDARATWEALGARRVITACPTCTRAFREGLPGTEVVSLWTVLAGLPALPPAPAAALRALAVHDPCAARHDRPVQDAVRALVVRQGAAVVEPASTRERTTCCGFGGLMSFADRKVADAVVAQRLAEREEDFVTCCAMCRDAFAARGKRALHVLDLLFPVAGTDPAARPAPGYSRRRAARRGLKQRLLEELWQGPPGPREEPAMELGIDPAVAAKLEERLILREEVEAVIARAERTGELVVDRATGHRLAWLRPALVTYWVEYSPAGAGYVVHSAWSHRMELTVEPAP